MNSWWFPLHRRLAFVSGIRRRGDALLCAQSFGFALVVPLLLRIPLPRLETLLERFLGRDRRSQADPAAIASTVLATLQAGRPLLRSGPNRW